MKNKIETLFGIAPVNPLSIIFPVLILLEIMFMFYLPSYHGGFSQAFTSIGGFMAALLLGGAVLISKKIWRRKLAVRSGNKLLLILPLVICIWLIIAWIPSLQKLFLTTPVGVKYSDIIPTIQVLNQRLMQGREVYRPIEEFGYHLDVTYLPLHWLPYLPAEKMRWDERWTAVAVFLGASLIILYNIAKYANVFQGILAIILFAFMLYWLGEFSSGVLSMSIEIMIAGYYMLLILSIGTSNPWLLAGGFLICLLSRYSLVLWLPLWAIISFIYGNRRHLFLTIGLVAVGVLVIYIIPFLSHDWTVLPKAYKSYSHAALGEWQHVDENGKPYHLFAGSGAAWYFYSHLTSYSLIDRIHTLQKVQLALCAGSVVILGTWYIKSRQRIQLETFLLGSFKIYLSVFLMFIQVPYTYLMITGPCVSLAIWAVLYKINFKQIGYFGKSVMS